MMHLFGGICPLLRGLVSCVTADFFFHYIFDTTFIYFAYNLIVNIIKILLITYLFVLSMRFFQRQGKHKGEHNTLLTAGHPLFDQGHTQSSTRTDGFFLKQRLEGFFSYFGPLQFHAIRP